MPEQRLSANGAPSPAPEPSSSEGDWWGRVTDTARQSQLLAPPRRPGSFAAQVLNGPSFAPFSAQQTETALEQAQGLSPQAITTPAELATFLARIRAGHRQLDAEEEQFISGLEADLERLILEGEANEVLPPMAADRLERLRTIAASQDIASQQARERSGQRWGPFDFTGLTDADWAGAARATPDAVMDLLGAVGRWADQTIPVDSPGLERRYAPNQPRRTPEEVQAISEGTEFAPEIVVQAEPTWLNRARGLAAQGQEAAQAVQTGVRDYAQGAMDRHEGHSLVGAIGSDIIDLAEALWREPARRGEREMQLRDQLRVQAERLNDPQLREMADRAALESLLPWILDYPSIITAPEFIAPGTVARGSAAARNLGAAVSDRLGAVGVSQFNPEQIARLRALVAQPQSEFALPEQIVEVGGSRPRVPFPMTEAAGNNRLFSGFDPTTPSTPQRGANLTTGEQGLPASTAPDAGSVRGGNGDGFDIDAFHGTPFQGEITRFRGFPDTPIWFAESEMAARRGYAGEAGQVIPSKLRLRNPLRVDLQGEHFHTEIPRDLIPFHIRALLTRKGGVRVDDLELPARMMGHDGIIISNTRGMPEQGGGGRIFGVFHPNNAKPLRAPETGPTTAHVGGESAQTLPDGGVTQPSITPTAAASAASETSAPTQQQPILDWLRRTFGSADDSSNSGGMTLNAGVNPTRNPGGRAPRANQADMHAAIRGGDKTARQIAQEFGYREASVYHAAQEMGVTLPSPQLGTRARNERILALVQEMQPVPNRSGIGRWVDVGNSYPIIAQRLQAEGFEGVTRSVIAGVVKRARDAERAAASAAPEATPAPITNATEQFGISPDRVRAISAMRRDVKAAPPVAPGQRTDLPTTVYHATTEPVEGPLRSGMGSLGEGVYSSRNPQIAERLIADESGVFPEGANIVPERVPEITRYVPINQVEDDLFTLAMRRGVDTEDPNAMLPLQNDLLAYYRRKGYVGIHDPDYADGMGQLVTWNASDRRAPWARMAEEMRHSSDPLSAGVDPTRGLRGRKRSGNSVMNVEQELSEGRAGTGANASATLNIPDDPAQWRELMGQHPWINSPGRAQLIIMHRAHGPDGARLYSRADIANATGYSEGSQPVLLTQARAAGVPIPLNRRGAAGMVPEGGNLVRQILDIMESAARNQTRITQQDIAARLGGDVTPSSIKSTLSRLRQGHLRVPELEQRLRDLEARAGPGGDMANLLPWLGATGGYFAALSTVTDQGLKSEDPVIAAASRFSQRNANSQPTQ